jgi:transposase, IS30 family
MGKNYRHLELQERVVLETQLRLGLQPAAIAAGLLRARSTVMREMRRNGWKAQSARGPQRIAGGYRCLPAQRRAQRLASKPRVPRKLILDTPLWRQVVDYLRQG